MTLSAVPFLSHNRVTFRTRSRGMPFLLGSPGHEYGSSGESGAGGKVTTSPPVATLAGSRAEMVGAALRATGRQRCVHGAGVKGKS